MRLLSKNPLHRYQSSQELYNALEQVAMSGVAPTMTPAPFAAVAPTAYSLAPGMSASNVGVAPSHPPGTSPPVGPSIGSSGRAASQPAWDSRPPTPAPTPITTYTAANGAIATQSSGGSKKPYVIVGAGALAVAAAAIAFLVLNKPADKPVEPVAAPPMVIEAGNALAEAERASSEERWEAAIAATDKVTRETDKPRAAAIATRAREQIKNRETLAAVERALSTGDLAGAKQQVATMTADSSYRRRADELVRVAEKQAADALIAAAHQKDPKRDPKKDQKRDPKRDPKQPVVATRPPEVKPPEVKPPEADDDKPSVSFDDAMMSARFALKQERFGDALKSAQAAMTKRSSDGEAHMIATIALCGLGQAGRAKAMLPKDRSSYREVAQSRCFKIGITLED